MYSSKILTFFAVEGEQCLGLVLPESVLQVTWASQGQSVNPGPPVTRLSAVRQHSLTNRGGEKRIMVKKKVGKTAN